MKQVLPSLYEDVVLSLSVLTTDLRGPWHGTPHSVFESKELDLCTSSEEIEFKFPLTSTVFLSSGLVDEILPIDDIPSAFKNPIKKLNFYLAITIGSTSFSFFVKE